MTFRNLRRITVWVPILFIFLLQIIEDFFLLPVYGQLFGHLLVFILVGVGAIALSFIVFRAVDRAENQLRQQNRDLSIVNEISRVVSGSLELDAILEHALDKILADLETEAGEVFLLDENRETLIFKLHRGLFPEAFKEITQFPIGEGFPGIVAQSGKPLVVTDLSTDQRFQRQSVVDIGFQAMASVPLRAKDQVVGVINVADRNKIFTSEDLNLLTAIGNQIGLAVENARLYSQVEETLGYLNAVIESSADAIITSDIKGIIQSWNPGAENIYGWTAEEAIGNFLPMIPEHLQEEVAGILGQLRDGETILNFETERLHKSGRLLSVMVTASPVYNVSREIIGLAGISKDLSDKKQLEQEITRQRQSLVILEERERIAREMHDGMGQVLGYVNTKAQAVRRFLSSNNPEKAQTHLMQLEEAAREVYADVREAILGLRTTVISEKGLVPTLEEYLHSFDSQSGIQTELIIDNQDTLDHFPPHIEVQLIRIIQEALTNIRKHAIVNQAQVRFEQVEGQTRVIIEDMGRGFNTAQTQRGDWPRFGLQTMRERAESVGGSLEIKSSPNQGTRILVSIPIETTKEN